MKQLRILYNSREARSNKYLWRQSATNKQPSRQLALEGCNITKKEDWKINTIISFHWIWLQLVLKQKCFFFFQFRKIPKFYFFANIFFAELLRRNRQNIYIFLQKSLLLHSQSTLPVTAKNFRENRPTFKFAKNFAKIYSQNLISARIFLWKDFHKNISFDLHIDDNICLFGLNLTESQNFLFAKLRQRIFSFRTELQPTSHSLSATLRECQVVHLPRFSYSEFSLWSR